MSTMNNGFKFAVLGTVAICAMAATLMGCGEKGDKAPEPTNPVKNFKPGDPPPPPMKGGKPVEGVTAPSAAPPMEGTTASQKIPSKK